MGTLVALAVVLAASVVASANNGEVQVQGGWVPETRTDAPDPDCGEPWPSAGRATIADTGIDTLGGSFVQLSWHCWAFLDPDTVRVFDFIGMRNYLETGEQATIELDEWIEIKDRDACIAGPMKSKINFTMYDFTGAHAAGRVIGQIAYVSKTPCSLEAPRIIAWYEGMFTPNAPRCGLGWELALLVPGLVWLHGRRRRQRH